MSTPSHHHAEGRQAGPRNGHRAAALTALSTFLDSLATELVLVTAVPAAHPSSAACFHIPPRPTSPSPAERPGVTGDILRVFHEVGHRLTTKQVMAELAARNLNWSESTVKHALSDLVDSGELDNRQDVSPRGYGLRGWTNGSDGG